jgi:1,4-dihydroxy-2-naphthoate octaprenyltransferase
MKKIQSKIILIIKLGRLHFLFPGFLLFLWGFLLASYSGLNFDWSKFFLGYFAFSLAHLSISFSNNYFDRFSDKNSKKTSFTGGSSILADHPELSSLTLNIAILMLCFSAITMIIFNLIYSYSYWFILYGIFGGLLGYFYSAPPLEFSHRGLGEFVSIISIGFLIPGMGSLVASGVLDQSLFLFIFPLSCYGLFFILTVEIPDLESDQIAKKDNIIVRRGRKIGHTLIMSSTGLATCSILILEISGLLLSYFPFGLLTIISILPLIASIIGSIRVSNERKELNNLVKLNMTSIIFFILIADLLLIFKLFLL